MKEALGLSSLENAEKTISQYGFLCVHFTILRVPPVLFFLKHIFSVMQVVIKHVAHVLVSYLPVVRNVCLFLLFSPNMYLKQPNV